MVDVIGYGRLRDLGGLPDLVRSRAGQEGLHRIFQAQDLAVELLDMPDVMVPMRDLVALYHRAATVTNTRSFGLLSSQDIGADQHGLIGDYIMQAPDLAHALQRFRRALPHHESSSTLEIEAEGDEVRIRYRNLYQNLAGWRHAGDFTLCVIADVVRGYLGDGWQPRRIETCYAKGSWEQDHEDLFGAPVWAAQDHVAVVIAHEELKTRRRINAEWIDAPVSLQDVIRMNEDVPRDFPHMVANTIDLRLIAGHTDIEGTAAALGLGLRTLQRRLRDHGVSYRDFAMDRRMRRARELLGERDLTVNQVSHATGYASTPQFTRAFKSYFGTTPRRFRVPVR